MFSALIEATSAATAGRRDGDRYTIIAVVSGPESNCARRSIEELNARGWRDIDVKRLGPVVQSEADELPGYLRAAVSDAEESGFGLVVYETPIRLPS